MKTCCSGRSMRQARAYALRADCKLRYRNETQNPKTKTRSPNSWRWAFEFPASDFLRTSDFGLRTSNLLIMQLRYDDDFLEGTVFIRTRVFPPLPPLQLRRF